MANDERLAREAQACVRLFQWNPPAVSYGRAQPLPAWLCRLRRAEGRGAPAAVVERPTGGGIAVHGTDVSVSVVVPRSGQPRLRTLMEAVCVSAARLCAFYGAQATWTLEAPCLGRIAYCLTEPSPYAVWLNGRKVAGFAIRRYPESWLIQGSLLVRHVPDVLEALMPAQVRQRYRTRAVSLAEGIGHGLAESDVARQWATRWTAWWMVERGQHGGA
jgi:lipoate-protein ligase A